MKLINWWRCSVGAACLCWALTAPVLGDPWFSIDTGHEWSEALLGPPPHIYGETFGAWNEYMIQWDLYLEEGEPYPETAFIEPELYVYGGGGGGGGYPEDAGLVMAWGTGALVPGEYASAWVYDYLIDPDLSNAIITLTVLPPQWGATGQITQISFGIQDALGRTRSWFWNVGPAGPILPGVITPITIHTNQTGLNAVSPPATGYMNTPGFDITQAQFFIADENAQWVGGPLPVPPPGGPPMGLWNYWHDIRVHPQWELTKWSQPPDPAYPDNVYYGWNEYSEWWYGPVVADDWVCTTPDPVTDVHWWGSFLGWKYAEPPQLPQHFHIQFWTDVPADPADPDSFSHPGQVIWETWAYTYTTTFVGWDYDPRSQDYEACFKFDYYLNPGEYFYQGPTGNIFWISIAACNSGPPQTDYPFGWKTRPRDPASLAPDDAVIIYDPIQPVLGSQYMLGSPIWWPTEDQSWDMAFEITTNQVRFKWVQPPDLEPTGIDVNATSDPFGGPQYILADDFLCEMTGPLTRIEIWGSWNHDLLPPPEDPGQVVFTLSIHADIPAGPSYSMPGDVLWWREFQPGEFTWQVWADNLQEGWMDPPDMYNPAGDTVCYRYAFVLNPGEFIQQGTPEQPIVYWLDVQARPLGTALPAQFGWKTSLQHWNDDAVWGQGMEPYFGPWYELRYPPLHPYFGQSIDLAFAVYGEGPAGLKWSQPPEPYTPEDAYNGWDQYSMYSFQIAADDWFCNTDNPVTDIHWWGSFIGWYNAYVPPQGMPPAFHIAIWTDVPADPADPDSFSHPGYVLWENYCNTYDWEFVGWDFDPRVAVPGYGPPPEATFKFSQYLDPNDWFWQEPGGNIYWLSIAALYPTGQAEYPWGWKTRPREGESPAPDDAVWISDPAAPIPGAAYVSGGPLYYPTPADSWDLAFELTSVPRDSVVCEPQGGVNPNHPPTYWYDVTPDDFGRCDFHVQVFDPNPANYTNVVSPPTWSFAVHTDAAGQWWASWWDPDCSDAIFTTFRFQFDNPNRSTWAHWTTTIGMSSDPYNQVVDRSENHAFQPDGWGYRVHAPKPTDEYIKWPQPPTEDPRYPGYFYGWNEPSLYFGPRIVADDWLCCDNRPISDIHWWGSYVGWIGEFPPQPSPSGWHIGLWTDVPKSPTNPWSHPEMMFHEWFVYRPDVTEQVVGIDFHPEYGYETCFRYDFYIPESAWFYQPQPQQVFWVSIAAIYDLTPPPEYVWGWKTRRPTWTDDAVRIFDPVPPLPGMPFGAGEPIENAEGSWDMAFNLTTPLPPPPVCPGDLNCDRLINFSDINPFVLILSNFSAWQNQYRCCSYLNGDINGDGSVSFSDINPFVTLLSTQPPPVCP